MHPSLTHNNIPRYVQLAELFRHRIAKGHWASGQKLPSLDELGGEFEVARVTVRQAVALLSREGLLRPQQGKGTFVTGQKAPDRWLRVNTTIRDLGEIYRGTSPELINITEGKAKPALSDKDGVEAKKYFYMRRVHCQEGVPYAVIGIYLEHEVFRKSPRRFRKELVIPLLLEMKQPRIAKARQTLTISTADVEIAGLLAIAVNAPVAEVRRVFNSADGTVIYLAEVTYRGDFVRMEMDLGP